MAEETQSAVKQKVTIIGGGPGGYTAAVKAAQLGAKVTIIESQGMGGTCLNRGCIPTKSLYSSVHDKEPFIDAMERKNTVVETLKKQVEMLMKVNKVEIVKGRGTIESKESQAIVKVNDQTIESDKIIIATGSKPMIPKAFDIDRKKVMTSDEILSIPKLPKSLLIIGGGYIGCEFASIFSGYGVDVTVVEKAQTILLSEDEDVKREVVKKFKQKGVTLHTGVGIQSIKVEGDQVISTLENNESITTDLVLVSVGRSPNSQGIEIVDKNDRGAILVNEKMETSSPNIYAIGDVCNSPLPLAHVAEHEGGIAAANTCGKEHTMDYTAIPSAIFTSPEIASVGKREFDLNGEKEDAEKVEYVVGKCYFKSIGMAYCGGNTDGFVKIIANPETREILGAAIVGDHASDMIHEIAIAAKSDALVDTLATSVHFHPSRSEAIMRAAQAAVQKLPVEKDLE